MYISKRELQIAENTRKRVRELVNYCEKYGEWPRNYRDKSGEKEKEGRTLNLWLTGHNYKYGKKTFDYGYVILDNSQRTDVFLDSLYEKYASNIVGSVINARKIVEDAEYLVNKYGRFPSIAVKYDDAYDNELNSKIYYWLVRMGFMGHDNPSSFDKLIYKDDITFEKKILELQLKSSNISFKSVAHAIKMIEKIEAFCSSTGEWPKQDSDKPSSKELYRFLLSTKYHINDNQFAYSNCEDLDGVNLKTRLDNLFLQYGHTNRRSVQYDQRRLEEVIDFCLKTRDFPKARFGSKADDNKYNNKLVSWIRVSRLFDKTLPFKYDDISINNADTKDLLMTYYAIFVWKKQIDVDNYNFLNLVQAKNSRNVGRILYYRISEYLRAKINGNEEDMLIWINSSKALAKEKKLTIDIDEIIRKFNEPLENALIYFYQEYCKYSLANDNNIALMFKSLYEYTKYVAINLEHNKDCDLSKIKSLNK